MHTTCVYLDYVNQYWDLLYSDGSFYIVDIAALVFLPLSPLSILCGTGQSFTIAPHWNTFLSAVSWKFVVYQKEYHRLIWMDIHNREKYAKNLWSM